MITAYHCVVLPFTPSQVLALDFLYRRLDFKGAHPCARHTFDVSFRSDKGSSSSPKHIRFLVWNFFVSLSALRRRLRVGPYIFPELPSQRLLGRKLSKRRRGWGGGILDQRPKGSHAPYCLLPRMPRVFGPEDDTVLQV